MAFKNISLENFRCFKTETNFELSRITLLTGENSSGKSSVIKALILLAQSKATIGYPLTLNLNGSIHNFPLPDSLFFQKKAKSFSISFQTKEVADKSLTFFGEFELERKKQAVVPIKGSLSESSQYQFSFEKIANKNYSATAIMERPTIHTKQNAEFMEHLFSAIDKFSNTNSADKKKMDFNINKGNINIVKNFDSLSKLFNDLYFKDGAYSLLSDLHTRFAFELSQMHFIGPQREMPSLYYSKMNQLDSVGYNGEGYLDIIYKWKVLKNKKYLELAKALNFIAIAKSVDSKPSIEALLRLHVKTIEGKFSYDITEVGYGVSQIIPVLVADIDSKDGSTIVVSQPELHLHPAAQAALASYFVKRIKTTKRNYIFETHSEYFINRLRLEIINEKIENQDVVINHIQLAQNGSSNKVIKIGKNAEFIDAPENFFETYYCDVTKIALGLK